MRVVVFWHLRKCGGTSVRNMFASIGHWAQLPYCKTEYSVLKMASSLPRWPFVFWESHCRPELWNVEKTARALHASIHRPVVTTFTVLRDPVAVAVATWNDFASTRPFASWVRNNTELLLFGKSFFALRRCPQVSNQFWAPQHAVTAHRCDVAHRPAFVDRAASAVPAV